MTTAESLATAEEFEEQRDLLFAVAYRMLGSATEAEDAVQDAYLRYRAVPRHEIRNPRSYLVTVVTRLCLDQLKSARARREHYVGPWLPEPVLTSDADWRLVPEGIVDLRESVSMALLVLLESLAPVERAVLLLHDVFDYAHSEIAAIVGKSEAACRQILRRARERVADRRPRFPSTSDEQRRLTEQFLFAAGTGDVSALIELLAQDAVAYSDGGGKVAAALNPIHGADRIARFIAGISKKEATDGIEFAEVNGQPAVLTWLDHRLVNLITLDIAEGRIRQVFVQRNPDKLRRLRRVLRPKPTA